jgi:DNA-binding XRE family transcriptional regulator
VYVLLNRERVEELRRDRGWTQRTFAEAAGICPATARRAERGDSVSLWTARKVAAALCTGPVRSLGRPLCRA